MPNTLRDIDKHFLVHVFDLLGEPYRDVTTEAEYAKSRFVGTWADFRTLLSRLIKPDGKLSMSYHDFRTLMVFSNKGDVSEKFFESLFASVNSVAEFAVRVKWFRILAMRLYGNFKFAFNTLARPGEEHKLLEALAKVKEKTEEEFTFREEFSGIEPIDDDDLYLLGYLSGQHIRDIGSCIALLEELESDVEELPQRVGRLSPAQVNRLRNVLTRENIQLELKIVAEEQDTGKRREALTAARIALAEVKAELEPRQTAATTKGLENSRKYMGLEHLDVYFATSMGQPEDFRRQRQFIREVLAYEPLKRLKLRYFDPTLSYMKDRINKGLLESLMLKRAKVTIYNAGLEDTLGKDSELAATLAQGKPVVVYVEDVPAEENPDQHDQYNRRADKFHKHPLGLQVDVNTGVAHGVIVVRSPQKCAELLYDVLLNKLNLDIVQDEHDNFLLIENKTKSILRVVSGDRYLTEWFWILFH